VEIFRWRLQVAYAPGTVEYEAMSIFVDRIREKSEGRLIIEYFPGGALVPILDQMTHVGKGTIEAGLACGLYWPGIIPVATVESGMPFQYSGPWEEVLYLLHEFEDGRLMEIYREAYAKHNVYLVGLHTWLGYPPMKSAIPIRTIADLEGAKVRVIGEFATLMAKAGAGTMWIPAGELYMALALGTVDIAMYSVDGVIGLGLHEVMNYLILPTLAQHATGHIKVNMDAWNALPEDLRQIFREAEQYIGRVIYEGFREMWEETIARADELAYEVIWLPDEEVEKLRRLAIEHVWPAVAARDELASEAISLIKRFYEIEE
jgi:TRAP-type mannitol/chloroaromatic compound transport system substrate-binding protein